LTPHPRAAQLAASSANELRRRGSLASGDPPSLFSLRLEHELRRAVKASSPAGAGVSPYSLRETIKLPLVTLIGGKVGTAIPAENPGPLSMRGPGGEPAVRVLFLGDLSPLSGEPKPLASESFKRLVASADLLVVNLEAVVTRLRRQVGREWARGDLQYDVSLEFVRGVVEAIGGSMSRTIFSVANNHAGDCEGEVGLGVSVANVEWAGAAVIGVSSVKLPGGAVSERGLLSVVELKGLRIGLVAWTKWMNSNNVNRSLPVWREEDVMDETIE
jgi:hypothetical protein